METQKGARTRDNLALAIGLTVLAVFAGMIVAPGAWVASVALSGGAIAASGLDIYRDGKGRRLTSIVRIVQALLLVVNVANIVLAIWER